MNTLKRENMNMLMIGTVKNDLLGALESAVQNTDGSFKVYNVASGSAYTIFMLAEERFWGFTDVAPTSCGKGWFNLVGRRMRLRGRILFLCTGNRRGWRRLRDYFVLLQRKPDTE